MKRLIIALLLFFIPTAAQAAEAIVYGDTPGQTLYVRIRLTPTTSLAIALTEGGSQGVGFYYVTEAQLVSAGLTTAGNYSFKVFDGTPSQSADDPQLTASVLPWDGDSVTTVEAAQVLAIYNKLPPGALFGAGSTYTTGDELGEAIEDAMDTIVAAIGDVMGADPISPKFVDDAHTWRFESGDQLTAKPTIREVATFDGLVAMSFIKAMPTGTSVFSITSVTVTDSDGVAVAVEDVTVGTPLLMPDKTGVHIPLVINTAGDYVYAVKIVTADSQVITRKGEMTVEDDSE